MTADLHPLSLEVDQATLPAIEGLAPEHIVPMIASKIAKADEALSTALATKPYRYATTILPLERAWGEVSWVWSVISHIEYVATSDAWHEAYSEALALISVYYAKLGQNKALYEAICAIEKGDEALDNAQKTFLANQIRDFTLSGVHLAQEKQADFLQHEQALSKAQSSFEHHLLKATDDWYFLVEDEADLAGLSDRHRQAALVEAKRRGKEGWAFDLKPDAYQTVMLYAKDRSLREAVYKAYATRASNQADHAPKWDNGPVMEAVLQHRLAQAKLLGYVNSAETLLLPKMVNNAQEVLDFLEALLQKSHGKALSEREALEAFAKEQLGFDQVQPWDIAFVSEVMRQALHGLDQEELRAYFPLDQVLPGLIDWIEHLWGVRFEVIEADSWHPSVQVLRCQDAKGQALGFLYLDLQARANKRGGAWVSACRERTRLADGSLQLPVVFLTCNFAPATDDTPSLLTHCDVVTLFHEMGHALHHLLTTVETPGVAGTSGVAWDGVELPSQWMEQWAWQVPVLKAISAHYQSKEPLDDKTIAAMLDTRKFQKAMMVAKQLEYALFDMQIHLAEKPLLEADIHHALLALRESVSVWQIPDYHRFEHGFSHIFAGGYAAGYYSYLWAEVLSSDAFSLFVEKGEASWPDLAQSFLTTILSKGGSVDLQEAFCAFRGRAPAIEPLLHDLGLD